MYDKRDTMVLYFGFTSVMWGLMPLWVAIWSPLGLYMVYGWFGIAVGLMATVGMWYDLTQRGCSVWRIGLAFAAIIVASGSIGQVYISSGWWGAFGLLFVLDSLAWALVSREIETK